MEWFVATPLYKPAEAPAVPAADAELPRLIKQNTFTQEQAVFRGDVPEDQPRFVVAYQHGIVQLMKHESDSSPIVCRLANTVVVQCAWSPDGSILAVAGFQTDLPEDEKNVVHFLTPFGAVGVLRAGAEVSENPNDEAVGRADGRRGLGGVGTAAGHPAGHEPVPGHRQAGLQGESLQKGATAPFCSGPSAARRWSTRTGTWTSARR